jgi:hypothetical protein
MSSMNICHDRKSIKLKAEVHFSLQEFIPKGKYAGHHPNAAVIIGNTPIAPHQLLKLIPINMTIKPATILMALSADPTFFFIARSYMLNLFYLSD